MATGFQRLSPTSGGDKRNQQPPAGHRMVADASSTDGNTSSRSLSAAKLYCSGAGQALGQTAAMRLSAYDRLAIRRAAAEVAGPDARVYLFRSRTPDDLRGGDIDLLAELAAPQSADERLKVSVRTAATLPRLIGEREIDVPVARPPDAGNPVAARRT